MALLVKGEWGNGYPIQGTTKGLTMTVIGCSMGKADDLVFNRFLFCLVIPSDGQWLWVALE